MPFGRAYRGGVSLATGWLAGSLGGAKRIIVSQLADKGSVKIFSSGSALDGGPSIYLQSPLQHGHGAHFREMASFQPFDGFAGTRVATTSTTTGANLLVSGVAAGRTDASVLKYEFVRPTPVEDARSRASGTSLVRKRIAASHSGRRLGFRTIDCCCRYDPFCNANCIRQALAPPPTPPHKGEGSTPCAWQLFCIQVSGNRFSRW